jgi:hypothetical protein
VVHVRAATDDAVKIDHVSVDDPALVCTWADGPGALATLKIRVNRSRLRGSSLESAVRVYVASPEPSLITIPVHLGSH